MTSTSSKPHNSKDAAAPPKRASNRVQTITCKCGKKIMLVPDVKAMSKAIETHAESHRTKNKQLTEEDLDKIRGQLIEQIFCKIP